MTATEAKSRKRASLAKREADTPTIEFGLVKSLGYKRRFTVVAVLVIIGFAVQVITLNAWYGVPFLLAALVLTWVRGYDSKLDRRHARIGGAWEETDVDRIGDILTLDRKMRSWDSSLMDISNAGGALMFLLAIGAVAGSFFLLRRDWPAIATIAAVDGALLIVPQWFNGMRYIQTRGDLVLKASHVQDVLARIGTKDVESAELKARMHMVGREDQRSPDNFKLVASYADGPEGFYGVQAQVVINRVQGTGHPYFYACIVGKDGLGLLKRGRPASLPDNVIVETETKDDVDVIIIRQRTSRTSGYHTKVPTSAAILRTALRAAQRFVRS